MIGWLRDKKAVLMGADCAIGVATSFAALAREGCASR